MGINHKLWYIQFYMFLHNKLKHQLPKDSCSLRNQLIKTFVLFILIGPLWLLIAILERVSNANENVKSWYILLISIFLTVITIGFLWDDKANVWLIPEYYLPYAAYLGPLIILVIMGILIISFISIVGGIRYVYNMATKNIKPKNIKPKNIKPNNPIKKLYKSWKEKYCEKIRWV